MKKSIKNILIMSLTIGTLLNTTSTVFAETSTDMPYKNEIFMKGDGEKIELTEEEKRISAEKENSILSQPQPRYSSKRTVVANAVQETSYFCGPATAYNIIWGDYIGKGIIQRASNSVPTQTRLSSELGTTTNGTNFGTNFSSVLNKYLYHNYVVKWGSSNWENDIKPLVKSTINSDYGLVANLNHGYLGSDAINSVYQYGAAHYITVYGYDDNGVIVSDSNGAISNRVFSCTWRQLAKSTQARGIIY